jgi:hypothetical protein
VTDFVTADPAPELQPPARTPAVTLTSGGEALGGVLHVPAGPSGHRIALTRTVVTFLDRHL